MSSDLLFVIFVLLGIPVGFLCGFQLRIAKLRGANYMTYLSIALTIVYLLLSLTLTFKPELLWNTFK